MVLAPLRVAALVALALGVRAANSASFYLPEQVSDENRLVTQQLATLGIEQFTPPNSPPSEGAAAKDNAFLWSLVPNNHKQIDLVWSTDASSHVDHLRFAKSFTTKINHLPGLQQRLTNGDAFHKYIEKTQHTKEKYLFNYVPTYLRLPRDHAQLPDLFAATLKRVEFEMKRDDDWYIYQRFLLRELPANGNDGLLLPGVIIASDQELQEKLASPEFKDKDVEMTQYIEPFLIDGHKFQVGFYVAVTSLNPLRIYTYAQPQIKIAKKPYPAKMDATADRASYNFNEYIAPWDFPDLQKMYYEFPSKDRTGTNSWTVLKRYLMLQGLDTTQLQKEIHDAIVASVASSRGFFQSQVAKLERFTGDGETETDTASELQDNFFELLRVDFELDDMGKPWLTRAHSNPSMAPHETVFGTDEAVKKHLLLDLISLVGVHPLASPAFEGFFGSPQTAAFCTAKCKDNARTWDTSCWSCPGWFAPPVANKLFTSMHEYARRGGFKLVFPALDDDYSKYMDNALTEHDHAFNRYVKSLSNGYAERQDALVSDAAVTCVYREHCSEHGDCVNGKCICDDEYEGATCYIPKDMAREKRLVAERAAAAARAKESWKERLWGGNAVGGDGGTIPDDLVDAKQAVAAAGAAPGEAGRSFSAGNFMLGLFMVAGFAYGGYQVYLSHSGSSILQKDN